MNQLFTILLLLLISSFSFSQGPTAQFTALPITACVGENITFTSTSTPGNSTITQYNWNFGDGNSGNTANVSHNYANAGNYTITLVVTDQNNLSDPEVKTNYITINPLPTAQFTNLANGCSLPVAVSFTNTSSSGGNYAYSWNFGNSQTSTVQNPPTINYATAGTFNVSLTVTNTTTNCTNTITNPIIISNFNTDFTVVDSVCVGSTVSVTDNSSIGVNSWSWNNGNGQTSTAQNPTFTYNTPGTYTISLTSQNTSLGCSGNKTKQIVVVPLPNPTFTATPTSGCIPLIVNFTNTTVGGSNFIWNFGDGSSNFNGQTPPAHTYNTNGSFTVSLTTTGVLGCVKTTTITNLVHTNPPNAGFSASPMSGCSPLTVNFTDTSSSIDPITSWAWTFGNGQTFNGQNPPAQIFTTGIYDVTLTIITQNGCTDTESRTGYIQVGAIDLVDFDYSPLIQCAKNPVEFTDLSVISIPHSPGDITYSWDFGDDGTSTLQNPTWSYPTDTGYFDVQLVVTFRGCKDTMKIDSAVFIKAPISLFSPAQTLYCNPTSFPVNVVVNDNAIIGKPSDDVKMIWRWDEPGTNVTVLEDADLDPDDDGSSSFDYPTYGTYTIKQVVHNYTTGCADSTIQQIIISQTLANFSLSNDSICKNGTVTLTSTSTSTDGLGTYVFDMDNGFSVNNSPANYTYTTAGSYDITLTTTNNVGCSGTYTFVGFDVLELPIASISPSITDGCAPINIVYTNTSQAQGNGFPTMANSFWTFPDNSTQTTNNINTTTNYNLITQGTFTTTLVTTDGFGCVSLPGSTTTNITLPTPNFTIDSVVCNNILVEAINSSTGLNPLTYQWTIDNSNNGITTDFSHTFTDASTNAFVPHKITLIATDGNGCVDSITVNIKTSLPQALESYSFTGANLSSNNSATCPPIFGNYQNNSIYYGNTPNYYWQFGDGNTSTEVNPQNIFVFAGSYNLSLKLTDQFGCKDSIFINDHIVIGGPTIIPSIIPTPDLCDNAFIFDTLNPTDVDHFEWSFGDGITTTTVPVTHNYPTSGVYYLELDIYDIHNCKIPYKDTFNITTNQLDANFTASPMTAEMGTNIIFDDQSLFTAPIATWTWNFNDFGNTIQVNSSDTNVSFSYNVPNLYPVTLIVTDFNGCIDSTTLIIHITGDIDVPNVFTPNKDGANDTFAFPYDIFKYYDVLILNRWGNVVYELKNEKGTYIWGGYDMNLNESPDGVYFYQIKGVFNDDTPFEKNGFLTKIGSK